MPKEVKWNLENFNPIIKNVENSLIKAGLDMEGYIKKSFKKGTGREYKVSKTGPAHIASAPGQPPAVDTGRLRSSITTNWSGSGVAKATIKDPVKETKSDDSIGMPEGSRSTLKLGGEFKVVVGSNVKYSSPLEFGTSKMGARPFLRPALEKFRPRILKILKTNAKNT